MIFISPIRRKNEISEKRFFFSHFFTSAIFFFLHFLDFAIFNYNFRFLFYRSQVVREACITIAYMSQVLRQKVDRFLEALMQNIINLIPNSAKVMSSSGIVAMRFIIQNTFSQRFVPIICSNIHSKSKDIRRHCCEFLDQLLHTWPTQTLVSFQYSN